MPISANASREERIAKPKNDWLDIRAPRIRIKGRKGTLWNEAWTELQAPPTTDADIEAEYRLKPGHARTVNASKGFNKKGSTTDDYNGRLFRMCIWLANEYPDREQVEMEMTQEKVTHRPNSKNRKEYFVRRVNLNYENLEPGLIIAFLSSHKIRKQRHRDTGLEREIHNSPVHMRKYLDAMATCCKTYGRTLDLNNLQKMHDHKLNMRKEHTQAASKGKTVKCDADPIPYPMYATFAQYLFEKGDTKSLAWCTQEWNMMGRSQHVENLTYHAMEVNNDALRMHHDGGKGDQQGERNTYKHMYANPFNVSTCPITTMALHFAFDQSVDEDCAFVFPSRDADGATFRRVFYEWINTLDPSVLALWVRPGHATPHGFRKGSTTHVGTQTMCPPPMASICRRAEWTMGDMLDIYMNFGDVGDRYLGRILAGLNPNAISFTTLPPHFTCEANDERITIALTLTFPHLMANQNLRGVLTFMLASLVHHSTTLMDLARADPHHPFNKLRLYQDEDLLTSLRGIVTTTTTTSDALTMVAIGIPAHILNMVDMERLSSTCVETLTFLHTQHKDLRVAITEAINARDAENGILSAHALNLMLQKQQEAMQKMIETAMSVQARTRQGEEELPTEDATEDVPREVSTRYQVYSHHGGFWAIPQTYRPPKKLKRRDAWYLWFKGRPDFMEGDKHCPIRPFRDVKLGRQSMVHDRSTKKALQQMRVVFEMMEEALPPIPRNRIMTNEWCETNYLIATRAIEQSRASYVYPSTNATNGDVAEEAEETDVEESPKKKRRKMHPERFLLSTWAIRLRPSFMSRHAQQSDVQNMTKEARPRGGYKRKDMNDEDESEDTNEEESEDEDEGVGEEVHVQEATTMDLELDTRAQDQASFDEQQATFLEIETARMRLEEEEARQRQAFPSSDGYSGF